MYAVFSTIWPIKFRASDLKGNARYAALKNFNWSLELALGGEWGYIASPDPTKINLLLAKAEEIYRN